MTVVCDQCRKRVRGAGHRTATRTLCDDCYATLMGASAGYLSTGTVQGAISTSGWFRGFRRRRGEGR